MSGFTAYEMLNGLTSGVASLGRWDDTEAPTIYRSIYWYDKEKGYRRTLDTFVFAVMSSSFGALHAIAWRSQFPTFAEQQLWRYSCLTLTVYPLAHLLVIGCGVIICCCGFMFMFIGGTLLPFFMGLAACCYAAARIILFVLPFLQLRSLPETVHSTITWADFFPHI